MAWVYCPPAAATVVGGLLRFVNLGRPDAFAFDEVYYAKDALALLRYGHEQQFDDSANELILASDGNWRTIDVFKDDPAFQEIVYGLALKVLNQTHQAISNPSGGKSKAARAKKEAEVFTISKDGISVTLPLRTPRSRLSVDREALEFLGFAFVGEGDEAELESETFLDNAGTEQAVNRKNIITALQQQTAFEGYSITAQ
mgnify:CR=1 FL=1